MTICYSYTFLDEEAFKKIIFKLEQIENVKLTIETGIREN